MAAVSSPPAVHRGGWRGRPFSLSLVLLTHRESASDSSCHDSSCSNRRRVCGCLPVCDTHILFPPRGLLDFSWKIQCVEVVLYKTVSAKVRFFFKNVLIKRQIQYRCADIIYHFRYQKFEAYLISPLRFHLQ